MNTEDTVKMSNTDRSHVALWLGRMVKWGKAELSTEGLIKRFGVPLSDEVAIRLLTGIAKDMERNAAEIRQLLHRINGKGDANV